MNSRVHNRPPYEPDKHGRATRVDVRTATFEDIEAIALIDEARGIGSVETLVPRILASFECIARGEVRWHNFVASVKSEVVGYAICRYHAWSERNGDPQLPEGWYLAGLNVLPSHRRRGVGRALTEHRITWLTERTDVVYFTAAEANGPSIGLLEALGFTEVARGLVSSFPRRSEELQVLGEKSLTSPTPLTGPSL